MINSVKINDGATTVYDREIKIILETSVDPTVYRIAEKSDLSGSEWKKYDPEITYMLSSGYGKKTIYLQVTDGTQESEAISTAVEYAEVPESGSIGRDAVRAYQTKYDGHKISVDKNIKGNK